MRTAATGKLSDFKDEASAYPIPIAGEAGQIEVRPALRDRLLHEFLDALYTREGLTDYDPAELAQRAASDQRISVQDFDHFIASALDEYYRERLVKIIRATPSVVMEGATSGPTQSTYRSVLCGDGSVDGVKDPISSYVRLVSIQLSVEVARARLTGL
jgi:hypothetical protein